MHGSGTAWHDQALSERIAQFRPQWRLVVHRGRISRNGEEDVRQYRKQKSNRISFNKKVTKMEYLATTGNNKISVLVAGEEKYPAYNGVFNSAPLGSMQ